MYGLFQWNFIWHFQGRKKVYAVFHFLKSKKKKNYNKSKSLGSASTVSQILSSFPFFHYPNSLFKCLVNTLSFWKPKKKLTFSIRLVINGSHCLTTIWPSKNESDPLQFSYFKHGSICRLMWSNLFVITSNSNWFQELDDAFMHII